MRAVVDVSMRALGGAALAAASALTGLAPQAGAQPPPAFPNLDTFTAMPAEGYLVTGQQTAPRIGFTVPSTASSAIVCDFYGGPSPAPQPSADLKCRGDIPGLDDVPVPGGRARPGDCLVGAVDYKGPGYQLSRMSEGGCDGSAATPQTGAKALGAGQKVSYLSVTCAVGADSLVACLDTTSGDHGFVLQRSGSWAF
ncbi:hypothetical protein A5714_23880 [Mycobacterium sp. E2462]|uniref:hypothetical protein n=1 Tax=Mycobacterium sp. E2462 TaxID=1834133 RepID=UPI0007FF2520|nr:hypothetical protein [Mycobacterium sp. E2462]OBI05973.1 hypothetical protein A5714_23880 [Mycobacterium sp. E2462]